MKRRVYVLWYQSSEVYGWPTLNTLDEKLPNVFTSRKETNDALKDHNKRWPEDKKEIYIKIFEEVSR